MGPDTTRSPSSSFEGDFAPGHVLIGRYRIVALVGDVVKMVGFAAILFLAFGVAFELPLFVFFLAITGIVSARQLFAGTPYAVLAVFIVGAMLTPPDFVSQILLAVPMLVLYLSGAAVAWIFDPQRRAEREARRQAEEAGAAVQTREP